MQRFIAGLSLFLLAAFVICDKPATAADQPEVDLELGEEIMETCAGCHGEFAQGSKDGEYPRLASLSAEYIEKQLRQFKSRKRINIPMDPYATERELPEEDLVAVAGYISQIELPTKLPPVDKANFDAYERLMASKRVVNIPRLDGDITAGRRLYDKECASCHARDGMGKKNKAIPPMAGQYSHYLRRQFENYARGKRVHDDEPDDRELFEPLSEAQVTNMLAYFSILDDE